MARILRVGVIGMGIGLAHARGYASHPCARVVAAADPDEQRLEERCDELGIEKRYLDAVEMLRRESLDIVSVATPNKYHKPLTLAALKAGCHVLCEKPMAMNAREARAMLATSRRMRRRLMINFSYRFTDQSMALKRQVESGILGEIYFGRTVWHRRRGLPGSGWFGQKDLAGGGPLIDLGVHRLDLALWLMGYPRPVHVMGSAYCEIGKALAKAQRKRFDVEDLAVGLIRFANGATLEVEASWAAHIAEKELMETRLLGSKGGLLQYNVDEGYGFQAEIYLDRGGDLYDMKLHDIQSKAPSAMYHFVDSIISDQPHMATAEEGLLVMEILDAIYRSARSGRPVRL